MEVAKGGLSIFLLSQSGTDGDLHFRFITLLTSEKPGVDDRERPPGVDYRDAFTADSSPSSSSHFPSVVAPYVLPGRLSFSVVHNILEVVHFST